MKKYISIISFFILSIFLLDFIKEFSLDARPGRGGSYRSSSSFSRSSSSSYRSSSSRSYPGGSYHSSGGGGGSGEDIGPLFAFIFWAVFGLMSFNFMLKGLDKTMEDPDVEKTGAKMKVIGIGLVLALVSSGIASLTEGIAYFFLFFLVAIPFILFFLGIKRFRDGREVIFVAKGESSDV
jgi:hypothetical protein